MTKETSSRIALIPLLIVFLMWPLVTWAAPYSATYGGVTYNFSGVEWYVSPSGTSSTATGTGSIANPWNLQTAFLGAGGKIQAGDVVWIRGGIYDVPTTGPLTVNVSGTAGRPVVFRNYNNERATIDGRSADHTDCYLNGSHVWLWGLEITDSNPATPTFAISYGTYGLMSGTVASVQAKLINLVVHDNYNGGLGLYADLSDLEVYGTLSFNNGRADSPNHGYGMYSQNQIGQKTVEDSHFFNNFGNYPLHIYTESGYIDNYRFRRNSFFGGGNDGRWILVGGSRIAQNPTFEDNVVYGVGFDLGFQTFGAGVNLAAITKNLFWGTGDPDDRDIFFNPINTNTTFNTNRIYNKGTSFSRSTYPANSYLDSRPTGTEISYRPNKFDAYRASVSVLNWGRVDNASIDLSQIGFKTGDRYTILDIQNYYGPPIASGIYSGSVISLPLNSTAVQQAVARPPGFTLWQHTDKEFNVFTVTRAPLNSTVPSAPRQLRIAP